MAELFNQELLATIITGRVEPHIYAFTTNTIPNYLKVGDTYRPVSVRLKEWQIHYPNLEKTFEGKAKIEDVYFRDFSVHDFLEGEKHKLRLQPADLCEGIYYSKEFLKTQMQPRCRRLLPIFKLIIKIKRKNISFIV